MFPSLHEKLRYATKLYKISEVKVHLVIAVTIEDFAFTFGESYESIRLLTTLLTSNRKAIFVDPWSDSDQATKTSIQ
jgi:hypothetical protein